MMERDPSRAGRDRSPALGRPRGTAPGVFVLLGVLALAASCCRLPDVTPPACPIATSYAQPSSDGREVMRVVIPPFQDQTGSPQQAEDVRTALMRALGKRQKFEMVALGEHELREFLPQGTFESGVISRDTLLAAARRYRADGVLFGNLTEFRPYEPIIIGLSVELASVGTGEVVWSSSGLYDAASRDVTQDVHNFSNKQLAGTSSLEGWRIILMSPSRFTEYACSRLADTLP
jgi:hypothetical protein